MNHLEEAITKSIHSEKGTKPYEKRKKEILQKIRDQEYLTSPELFFIYTSRQYIHIVDQTAEILLSGEVAITSYFKIVGDKDDIVYGLYKIAGTAFTSHSPQNACIYELRSTTEEKWVDVNVHKQYE